MTADDSGQAHRRGRKERRDVLRPSTDQYRQSGVIASEAVWPIITGCARIHERKAPLSAYGAENEAYKKWYRVRDSNPCYRHEKAASWTRLDERGRLPDSF